MRKLLTIISLVCGVTLSGCLPETEVISSRVEDSFSIGASSTTFYLNDQNRFQVRVFLESGYVLNEHSQSKIQYTLSNNTCDGQIIKVDNNYYFVANTLGHATISANIEELHSNNTIEISVENSQESIIERLTNVLNTSGVVVFGHKYDIGIASDKAHLYTITGAEDIIRIDENGMLEVCGIGQGKIKFYEDGINIYDGRFTVYNSILATKIKEDLISQGKIESKSDNIPSPMLLNITTLNMSGELINDPSAINGISYLKNLVTLDLSDNGLDDASFISSISTLKNLNLANNVFTDISSIVDNENLQHLDLANNLLTQITQLQFLYKIKYLDLSNNNITDISPLSSSYSLESLFLNNNKIQNFRDSLSGLEDLKELGVGECGIPFTDIVSLRYLPNLTYLDISGTDPTLSNITNLSNLKN